MGWASKTYRPHLQAGSVFFQVGIDPRLAILIRWHCYCQWRNPFGTVDCRNGAVTLVHGEVVLRLTGHDPPDIDQSIAMIPGRKVAKVDEYTLFHDRSFPLENLARIHSDRWQTPP